jgi:hypothetical protein
LDLKIARLSRAAALIKDRSFKSDLLRRLDGGTVMTLRPQQSFPAMRQSQPEFAIAFVRSLRGKASALLDLFLEKIGCFKHSVHHNKSPGRRGFHEPKNASGRTWFRTGHSSIKKRRPTWDGPKGALAALLSSRHRQRQAVRMPRRWILPSGR